jgi:ankyrin repeat protein
MPPTLDECYMRILQGVNSRFQSEVVKALQWISLSFQPLSFREVNEACIIDLTESPVIKKENQFNGDGITACLPSLVTRTGGKETHLSLSHFSVKEFLKSSTIQDSAYSRYGFRESGAHAFIAESCIAYIYYYSSCPMRLDTQNDLENFPLLFYACRYWFEHLKLATEEEQERLAPLIIGFLTCWNVYSNALRIYNPVHPEDPFPCIIHTLASSLGWAATLGMEVLVKRLLKENSTEIDTIQDIQYTEPGHQPSHGICDKCIDDHGSFFMKFNADPIRGTALMKAVAHNHENIVRLLIENGADLHHIEQGYNMGRNSALSIACHNGNDKMVRVLLGYGADPNEIRGNVSALEGAIDSSSLDVCKTLLENGAHVDGSDSTQETPLMYAASNGLPDIGLLDVCKLLLDHGADINWNTKDDSNCPCDILSSVANNGNVKLVELFLSRGIHIRPQALL